MSVNSVFETAKNFSSYIFSCLVERFCPTQTFFLPTSPQAQQSVEERIVRRQFETLSQNQKSQVYNKVFELAKMEDPRISGDSWGEDHAFDNTPRLQNALHRLGFLTQNNSPAQPIRCLPFSFGEGGLGSQYFSLSERAGRDPLPGHVGYVNGMGIPTLEHAGNDAVRLSDFYVDGNNIHCVYHATHQATPMGDRVGFIRDVMRMKAVEGGSYTKTSYLVAQQWIDFLDRNPDRNYLQISASEGTAHVDAALRLINGSRPELLGRIRVISLCPAHFIVPETYGQGLQVINLFKTEDGTINPWATGISKVGQSPNIITVPHTGDHPHNHLADDYVRAGKRYVDAFMRSGNIY